MHRAVLVAVVAACSDPSPGASITVDGNELELPDVEATRIDTFYMVSATAANGGVLELGFPTSAAVGAHRCDEGRLVGLFTLSFTTDLGQRFSSVYPVSEPAHDCSFELEERGSTIELGVIGGHLADSGNTKAVQLTNGSFRAPVTQ